MARKVKTEKEKKKSKIRIIVIILIVVLVLGIGGFCAWKFVFNKKESRTVQTVVILDSLDEYGYSLSNKDSKYFKTEFDNLTSLLRADNVDEKEYATQVAKLFTIDLYTLSTKVNKYDIGGSEYYFKDKKDMFTQKVMDSLYSTMLDDTYGDRKQVLPEVSNVEIVSTEATKYKLGEKEVDAYLVKLNIKYVSDMGYDDEGSVVVCKEDSIRWSVVDFQPTLNPKYE